MRASRTRSSAHRPRSGAGTPAPPPPSCAGRSGRADGLDDPWLCFATFGRTGTFGSFQEPCFSGARRSAPSHVPHLEGRRENRDREEEERQKDDREGELSPVERLGAFPPEEQRVH